MWNEPTPQWRTARKQHQCQGDGCAKMIESGERYLDRAVSHPTNSHLRYCQECAEPVIATASSYHFFNGRNDFPDRYHEHISSGEWKNLKDKVVAQRGSRCERCGIESISLDLHHIHYRSLGNEQPEDVELLCRECHLGTDSSRVKKGRPQLDYPQEGLIVGIDGDRWSRLDPSTIYLELPDGRYVPIVPKGRS